mmetsp:Transcript_16869/g.68061  ORF Transcript_16869/g.68061 Transcript_16869/m.68061 type:complete len:305 (+) Transcript_16869:71-985(+)
MDLEIAQEDVWAVISAFFAEKGLVRQQLDSFDEFIQNTMQEIVDDGGEIRLKPDMQFKPGQQLDKQPSFTIFFNQVYVSKPTTTEKDGSTSNMFPHEARLRNMTYSSPMYVDVSYVEHQPRGVQVGDTAEVEVGGSWYPCVVTRVRSRDVDVVYRVTDNDERSEGIREYTAEHVDVESRIRRSSSASSTLVESPKEFMGYVPIMLRTHGWWSVARRHDTELDQRVPCTCKYITRQDGLKYRVIKSGQACRMCALMFLWWSSSVHWVLWPIETYWNTSFMTSLILKCWRCCGRLLTKPLSCRIKR